ncbi:MAG: 1-acyl-sn-glycerol-3-phosphate acyltransferase [Opitutaceae bacterium]|nr:1-acyl-sn-glycerol-3-phosphate acyltransferase [Opitutaceae bacterium]
MIFRTAAIVAGYYFTLLMFGLFGAVITLVSLISEIFPSTPRTERAFQRLIHRQFALFTWWTGISGLFKVRHHGFEHIPNDPKRGLVVVANHPSLVDITVLLSRIPEALCVFKPAIRRNPILGSGARRAGYLASDGGHEILRTAAEKVAAGNRLIVFPEGTRTPPGTHLLPFKPGFVIVARRAQVPIQLVRITLSRPVLSKDHTWWKVQPLPARADIVAGPLISVAPEADTASVCEQIERWFRSGQMPDPRAGARRSAEAAFQQ